MPPLAHRLSLTLHSESCNYIAVFHRAYCCDLRFVCSGYCFARRTSDRWPWYDNSHPACILEVRMCVFGALFFLRKREEGRGGGEGEERRGQKRRA